MVKRFHHHIIEKSSALTSKFRVQAAAAIITAFGLVIALAWKDVITDLVTKLNPFAGQNLLFSAVIVTIISIIGISLISRWANEPAKS